MTERTALDRPQKRYSTFIGFMLSTLFNVLRLSIIAWFFLFIGLGWRMMHSGVEVTSTAIIFLLSKTSMVIENRLIVFMLSLPLWMSVVFVMIVDGLVQRDICKFQGARESTFLFHRLCLLTRHVFYGFFLLLMSLPWQIPLHVAILMMLLIVCGLLRLMIKHYKKYI